MRNRLLAYAFFILVGLLALRPESVPAADLPAPEASAAAFVTGTTAVYRIALRIPQEFYLYHTDLGHPQAIGIPLTAQPESGGRLLALATSAPHTKGQMLFDGSGKSVQIKVHEQDMLLWLRVELNSPAQPLPAIALKGQMCNASQCLPVALTVRAQRAAAPFPDVPALPDNPELMARAIPAPAAAPSTTGQEPRSGIRSPLRKLEALAPSPAAISAIPSEKPAAAAEYPAELPTFQPQTATATFSPPVWFALAFLAGVILNFMPCVLPVISLKLIGFASQAGEDRRRSVLLSLAFAAGILSVFLLLGLAAAFLGMQWGEQFQSETFNIALVAIIFAFALSFFGLYEFGLPGAAGALPGGGRPAPEGYGGSFLTGMVSTLLATPCSGPFLGAALAWALTQPAAVVLAMFLAIGSGMACPYLLLSASDRLRRLLPRPGNWMLTLRRALGYVMLLTAVYLLFFLRAENLVPTAGTLVAVALACEIIGKTALSPARRRWLGRVAALAVVIAGAMLFFAVIKPALTPTAQTTHSRPFDYTEFQRELAAGRNVFIDFTADWCPNCKYNEHFVLAGPLVRHAMREKGVTYFVADLTEENERTAFLKRFMNALGGRAIPFAAVFSHDQPLRPHLLPDVLTKAQVLDILEALPTPTAVTPR